MQGRRGAMTPFTDLGDPFGAFEAVFGGFGSSLGGLGNRGSLLSSSLFGGRDPFDDPFFTSPFGGGGLFASNLIGSPFAGMHPSANMHPSASHEHRVSEPTTRRGPIIEELNSDDEEEKVDEKNKENPRKHGRSSKEPIVDLDDENDETEGRKNKQLQYRNGHKRFNSMEQLPQTHSFSFQSSTVTYGGANGAYYTSSKTRRTGSDGVTFEENKEADSTTRQATHQISRGLHNKGHTLARKLKSDGKVDTLQTLHNLHEDELAGFEEAWNGNARQYLPGRSGNFSAHDNIGAGAHVRQGGWALPSTENAHHLHRPATLDAGNNAGSSKMQHSGRIRGSSDIKDKTGYVRGAGKRSS